MKPFTTFFILWIALLLIVFFALPYAVVLPDGWRVLVTLNLAAFLLFGIDKVQAQSRGLRVPERLLYVASFLGGSAGALLAMNLFRHKTRKVSFQLVLAFLILLQIVVILYWNGQTKIWF